MTVISGPAWSHPLSAHQLLPPTQEQNKPFSLRSHWLPVLRESVTIPQWGLWCPVLWPCLFHIPRCLASPPFSPLPGPHSSLPCFLPWVLVLSGLYDLACRLRSLAPSIGTVCTVLCILAEENSAWGVLRLLWIGLGGPVVAERPVERAVRMGVTVGMGKGV